MPGQHGDAGRDGGVIDIHSHIYPRWYVDLLKQRTEIPRITGDVGDERFVMFPSETRRPAPTDEPRSPGRPMDAGYWSIGEKLDFMDRFGIERTVLSLGNPWLDFLPADHGLDLARAANAEFAALEGETDGRILGMGVLPPGSPIDAAAIVEEIAETATLHGAVSGTRPCGVTFDDPSLEPLYEALARTGVPLLIHPHYGSALDELAGLGHAGPVAIAFPVETTIAVSRLIFSGVIERHPNLRLIASHAGGTLPYLAGRLDAAWRSDPGVQQRLRRPPSEELGRLFLDGIAYQPAALRAAADLVGADRISFGTDHPFSVADPERNLAAIDEAFSGDSREAVRHRSAAELFGLAALDD
jgi:aminocarboxymuconate-semialdehyde decarboxylase